MDNSTIDFHFVQHAEVYVANGNKLGVVMLQDGYVGTAYRQNADLCHWLTTWGRQLSVDSIMVVCQLKTAIAADVFEPWGQAMNGLAGSWSTMCGNGMMAITLFYEEWVAGLRVGQVLPIQTRSGIRSVTKLRQNHYSVCMGTFTFNRGDLSAYTQLDDQANQYLQAPLPSTLAVSFSDWWSIGLSGTRQAGVIDGEPHVVLVRNNDSSMDLHALRRIAVSEGPRITKNRRLFPQEINANFAVIEWHGSLEQSLRVLACTHERGLGNNAERSVTGACGTGATAIGATLYQLYRLPDKYPIHISMPRGKLQVYRKSGQFYLIGSAEKFLHSADAYAQ